MGPLPRQPGQQVLVLSELHLEASLAGAGAAAKDIENQARAVEDLDLEDAFEVSLLRGRQFIVEDGDFGVQSGDGPLELLELAPAEVERRRLLSPLLDLAHNSGARRVGQTAQLLHRVVEVPERGPRRRADADEDGPLGPSLRNARGWLGYSAASLPVLWRNLQVAEPVQALCDPVIGRCKGDAEVALAGLAVACPGRHDDAGLVEEERGELPPRSSRGGRRPRY